MTKKNDQHVLINQLLAEAKKKDEICKNVEALASIQKNYEYLAGLLDGQGWDRNSLPHSKLGMLFEKAFNLTATYKPPQ